MQCISAEQCFTVSTKGLICNHCHAPVVLVLDKVWPAVDKDATQTPRFFRHVVENTSCGYSIRNPAKAGVGSSSVAAVSCKVGNGKWMKQWQLLSPTAPISAHKHAIEIRDAGDPDTELVQIFDATHGELFEYVDFLHDKNRIFLCIDSGFEAAIGATMLVHCNDGRLLQSRYETPVCVMIDKRELKVRFLTRMDADIACRLDNHFKRQAWPPRVHSGLRTVQIDRPLKVLSVQGRLFVDTIHRHAFSVFPTPGSIKIIQACAGAGKSTAIKQFVRLWRKKRVLIVVFNKNNQQALQAEMKSMGKQSKVKVRTLDSLCSAVMPCKFEVNYEEGMDVDEAERLKLECHELDSCCLEETDPTKDVEDDTESVEAGVANDPSDDDDDDEGAVDEEESDFEFDPIFSDSTFVKAHFKNWNVQDKMKHGGGVGSAAMVRNRLLHPRAVPTICKFHKRLTLTHMSCKSQAWTAKTTTFPINKIVDAKSTFASRRFVCDRDNLLAKNFEKYDIVICDEYQVCFHVAGVCVCVCVCRDMCVCVCVS